MTYAVYLTHVWVVWVTAGARRELINLNAHSIALLLTATVLLSYLVGFLFTIAFEAPVIYALGYIKRCLPQVEFKKRNYTNQEEEEEENLKWKQVNCLKV